MFRASSLLLLTLVLNVQLCSSAPIPAKSPVFAEEPGQEKLIPAVAEEAPSSEESTAKEDVPVIAEESEAVVIGDEVSDDADKAESQEAAPQEPLAAAPQESSEEETVLVEAAFAEGSPDEKTEEVAPAVAAETESPEQNILEDPATPEELIPVIPLEASEDEASEGNVAEEAVPEESLLIVPDDSTAVVEEEPLPVTPQEEELVVLIPAELETEEAGQEEHAAEETAPEEPAVVVIVEPTIEEPAPEDPILIIPLEDQEEDAPEDITEEDEEEVIQSDPLPKKAAQEEDTVPRESEAGDSDGEILVTSVTETPSESETLETALDKGEEVPAAATEAHVATIEAVTAPGPAVTDAEAEIIPASVEDGNGTSTESYGEDLNTAVTLIEDKPVALVNRGTVLGAALFTLMSFIIIGFIWTTVSKKLR